MISKSYIAINNGKTYTFYWNELPDPKLTNYKVSELNTDTGEFTVVFTNRGGFSVQPSGTKIHNFKISRTFKTDFGTAPACEKTSVIVKQKSMIRDSQGCIRVTYTTETAEQFASIFGCYPSNWSAVESGSIDFSRDMEVVIKDFGVFSVLRTDLITGEVEVYFNIYMDNEPSKAEIKSGYRKEIYDVCAMLILLRNSNANLKPEVRTIDGKYLYELDIEYKTKASINTMRKRLDKTIKKLGR